VFGIITLLILTGIAFMNSAFMNSFDLIYYSFSYRVADHGVTTTISVTKHLDYYSFIRYYMCQKRQILFIMMEK
jgi:hypothetical protein